MMWSILDMLNILKDFVGIGYVDMELRREFLG